MKSVPTSLATIISAWLLVATLDLVAAIIQTLIYGGNVVKLLQFIASGLLGQNAFNESFATAIFGLILHYFIAFVWTIIFFVTYPWFSRFVKNSVVMALLYGVFIWIVMNGVVIRFSEIGPRPFNFAKALIAASILVVAVGLPLALIAKKYYSRRVASPH